MAIEGDKVQAKGEKRNPHILLVGMQASATILENNMEASLKTKHRSAI
jgi:hypothetical protein